MRNSLRQTLLFFTLIAVGTVKGDSPPTPSPEPLSIVLGDGSIIVVGDIILSIHGFTPFFDSQKGSVLLISDINEKDTIRLRADGGQSLVVTDRSGHLIHIDLQALLEKKAAFVPVDASIQTEKTGQFFSGITIKAKTLPTGLNGLPTSVFLQSSDYRKSSQREQYSGSLTPDQTIFSLAGLGSKGNSPLSTSHGLLGINDDKSILSNFLDYPITPTFVEVTAFMNYENYADTENVNDTMILLRFLVENLRTVELLYCFLMTAFFPAEFFGEEEFKERFRMENQDQPLNLESLYHFLISRKQSEIDNASQAVEGSTGGASAALPESESALTAVGYAIARRIRTMFPRNTDEKINSILEQLLGPAVTSEETFSRLPQDEAALLEDGQDETALLEDSILATYVAMFIARLARERAARAGTEESDEDETSSSSTSENSDFERWYEEKYGGKPN
ncbi:hypothetical protein [Endozoicomonas sp. 2B-B]